LAKNKVLFNTGQTNIGTSEGLGSGLGQGSHVNLSTGPVSVEPAAPTESFTLEDDSVQFELRSEECYQMLSIPLNLEYEIRFDRLSLLPGIGMQYDRVLSRERQFQNDSEGGFPTIETGNKSKENFFAYAFSLSAEYDLNTRFSLRITGRYKSWLTPIYRGDNFKSLPFVYSGQFGIRYRVSR
jgi:opacity protein-like surface antigen